MKPFHLVSALCIAGSPALAQGLSLQAARAGDVVTFDVAGAAPSGLVCLALDPMLCGLDVTGDRLVTAADVSATQANYGPCTSFAQRRYDQKTTGT
jgi:hypothetical protein